jgi:molybdopterin/thiamine biosynthesis adenylyltransferase/rhodanese-related sulfurtransferase
MLLLGNITILSSTSKKISEKVVSYDAMNLSKEEILRYSRHLIMPEVGLAGQQKLKASSVLIIGAGGLGSPVGMYLAAAGVGTIGIVDFDSVDVTNLQRQVLHSTDDIGRSKLESAQKRLLGINPHITLRTYQERLTSNNALDILANFDVIVDGTDNFPTRYLVNDACVLLKKPNVYGSIFRFDGQVSVFDAKRGPCYRCLYPDPPPAELVPSCAEGGVFGVLPGIIGTLQALEVLKLLLNQGEPLIGRLVIFDALKLLFRELRLKKNPACPACGEHPTVTSLIDYEEFCGVKQAEAAVEHDSYVTPQELKSLLATNTNIFVLDVREPHEYEICNIGGTLIPLNDLASRVNELDSAREIVVLCKTGRRSEQAMKFLHQVGFKNVKNLLGGIDAWIEQVDPTLNHY